MVLDKLAGEGVSDYRGNERHTLRKIVLFIVLCGVFGFSDGAWSAQKESHVNSIDHMKSYDRRADVPRKDQMQAHWLVKMKSHKVSGSGYEIITDHSKKRYLDLLEKLAAHRGGKVRVVEDFKSFTSKAKYIAIAPARLTEDLVVDVWESVAGFDSDKKLDAYVSFLVGPDLVSFKRLIQNSIRYETKVKTSFCVIANYMRETRSYEKAVMLHDYYSGRLTPMITRSKDRTVTLDDAVVDVLQGRRPLAKIKDTSTIEGADVLLTFGHGLKDNLCGYQVDAFKGLDFNGKAVLSGSCFSGKRLRTARFSCTAIWV